MNGWTRCIIALGLTMGISASAQEVQLPKYLETCRAILESNIAIDRELNAAGRDEEAPEVHPQLLSATPYLGPVLTARLVKEGENIPPKLIAVVGGDKRRTRNRSRSLNSDLTHWHPATIESYDFAKDELHWTPEDNKQPLLTTDVEIDPRGRYSAMVDASEVVKVVHHQTGKVFQRIRPKKQAESDTWIRDIKIHPNGSDIFSIESELVNGARTSIVKRYGLLRNSEPPVLLATHRDLSVEQLSISESFIGLLNHRRGEFWILETQNLHALKKIQLPRNKSNDPQSRWISRNGVDGKFAIFFRDGENLVGQIWSIWEKNNRPIVELILTPEDLPELETSEQAPPLQNEIGLNPTAIELSPTGNRVAIGTEAGDVFVWDITASNHKEESPRSPDHYLDLEHTDRVSTLQFYHNDLALMSGSADQKVLLWDIRP